MMIFRAVNVERKGSWRENIILIFSLLLQNLQRLVSNVDDPRTTHYKLLLFLLIDHNASKQSKKEYGKKR